MLHFTFQKQDQLVVMVAVIYFTVIASGLVGDQVKNKWNLSARVCRF